VVVLVFAIAVQAQTPVQTETGSVEQELINLENEWSNSSVKPDLAFIDRILPDDYAGTEDNGNVITKAQEMANLKSGEGVVTSAANYKMKVRVYGDAAGGIIFASGPALPYDIRSAPAGERSPHER
jgi:hypothetical protein